MCHSDQNGYKIYEAQPKKAFRVIYSTETELNRRLYGEPEIVSFVRCLTYFIAMG